MHATSSTKCLWLPSPLLLFLLPALLIVVFFVVPIGITGVISLTSLDYRFRWDFVGLANFLVLFQDALIPRVLLNTGVYVFTTLLVFRLGLGLVLALLTAALPARPAVIFRMLWLLPRFTPSVVCILLWRLLLDPTDYGLLNRLRAALALTVDLLTQHPLSVIVLVNGLTGASLGLVILLPPSILYPVICCGRQRRWGDNVADCLAPHFAPAALAYHVCHHSPDVVASGIV